MTIDFQKEGRPLPHTWSNCVGAGRANEELRADWQRQLKTVAQECGFRYLRFHGLLHDGAGQSDQRADRTSAQAGRNDGGDSRESRRFRKSAPVLPSGSLVHCGDWVKSCIHC